MEAIEAMEAMKAIEVVEAMETIEVMEAMEAIEVVEAIITEAIWALIVNGSLKALDLDSFASEGRKPPAGLASQAGPAPQAPRPDCESFINIIIYVSTYLVPARLVLLRDTRLHLRSFPLRLHC